MFDKEFVIINHTRDAIGDSEAECTCGHMGVWHEWGYNISTGHGCCTTWACTCGEFVHVDWITGYTIIPEKIS